MARKVVRRLGFRQLEDPPMLGHGLEERRPVPGVADPGGDAEEPVLASAAAPRARSRCSAASRHSVWTTCNRAVPKKWLQKPSSR
jgi:hypothetical protein